MSGTSTSTHRGEPLPGHRWRALLVPGLLVVIAGVQIVTSHGLYLSPWKGGGFGMFSTLDSISQRPLRVFAEVDGEWRRVALARGMQRRFVNERGWPTDRRLARIAERLQASVTGQTPNATAIRVEVWRSRFEGETSTLRFYRWRVLRYPLAEPGADGASEVDIEVPSE